MAWRTGRPPPVVIPAALDGFDTALVEMIEQHIDQARRTPRDARSRATLGLVYEANKMWVEARTSYMNATRLEPGEAMWPHHAAIAWMQTGDTQGAIEWMRQHAARFPQFAPLQHRLGVALLDNGEIAEADRAFTLVIARAPNQALGYIGLADAQLRAGDTARAARLLEQAIEIEPRDKTARYLLGRAYRALGRLEEAERELTLGMDAKRRFFNDAWSAELPKYTTGIAALQNRAADLLGKGRSAEGAVILEQLRDSDPDNVDVMVNLGIAYIQEGRIEAARDLLLDAAARDETRFETYLNLAACSRRLQRPEEALRYADRTVALAPKLGQAHYVRGLALLELGRSEEALEAFTASADLDARNPNVYQRLANLCVRLGRTAEARGHYKTLAKLLPLRWEPQLGLARVNLRLGRLDEAAEAIERGLARAPGEPSLLALARRLAVNTDR